MSGIFRAYDIRGAYPGELNEDIAGNIGYAFVAFLKAQRIVVGRDMRLSSPSLTHSFIEGARAAGADITDIGMVTSPLLYYAIGAHNFDGGAMVTASHLPATINGFKLCKTKAIPLSAEDGLPEIQAMISASTFNRSKGASKGKVIQDSVIEEYIDRMASFVHNPRRLKIVVDAGNGISGPEVTRLFKKFPMWEFTPMYMEPDGSFPHHVPNPLIINNTRELRERVIKEKADIGVAFDGDADRCGFIDETGEKIPEDLVTALISKVFLARYPNETVLYDLRSSRIVGETITSSGGKAERCRVGHSFIKAKMRQLNAIFAGELSGHYYFRDTGFTDNALFAMIQMLNLLSLKNNRLSELIRPLKKYSRTGEINMKVKNKDAIFMKLPDYFRDAKSDTLDGLTIEHDTWWFNLRPSNTEPLIRLNLEAIDENTMHKRKDEVIAHITDIDPTMKVVS